jgi:peptide/nickel transport system ATP-binding protein
MIEERAVRPGAGTGAASLLDVRGLVTEIRGRRGPLRVVDGVSLTVGAGEIVGLVGESGCGKSMTAFSLVGLFPTPAARVAGGEILFEGRDLRALSAKEMRAVRGARIAMVFQDPSSYLDPLMPVGKQVAETLRAHGRRQGVEARVLELLAGMELPDPAGVARRYPHELSGGQRQRVLIAAALAMSPALLIADEPTTALDVTVQASILDLLARLRATLGLGILLITHDLGIVAEVCDRVYVMYAGRVVETNDVRALFDHPRHPYTQGLLRGTLSVEAFSGELFSIPGVVPSPRAFPAACRFHPRCPLQIEVCRTDDPPLMARDDGADACWRALEPVAARTWDAASLPATPEGSLAPPDSGVEGPRSGDWEALRGPGAPPRDPEVRP